MAVSYAMRVPRLCPKKAYGFWLELMYGVRASTISETKTLISVINDSSERDCLPGY